MKKKNAHIKPYSKSDLNNAARKPQEQPNIDMHSFLSKLFCIIFGIWLALVIVKNGNPIILDKLVSNSDALVNAMATEIGTNVARNLLGTTSDLITDAWPAIWTIATSVIIFCFAFSVANWKVDLPCWLKWAPAVWLVWQFFVFLFGQNREVGLTIILHFSVCVGCFYVGLFALPRYQRSTLFWLLISLGFLVVLWAAFGQHYGGLEAIEEKLKELPNHDQIPKSLIERVAKKRVFGTMVYPNALASLIVLLLPIVLTTLWHELQKLHRILGGIAVGTVAYAGIASLYWTKSKAGWVAAIVSLVAYIFMSRFSLKTKIRIITFIVAVGTILFALRFSDYFARGATSAVARLDYWRAGVKIFLDHPIVGAGQGSFASLYAKIKPAEAEMAKLCHNDYLQQACDTGFIGAVLFCLVIFGSIYNAARNLQIAFTPAQIAVFMGLVGWAFHECFEFGLYIPALAWPAFLFLGWLSSQKELSLLEKSNQAANIKAQ